MSVWLSFFSTETPKFWERNLMMTATIHQHKTTVAVLCRKHVTPPTCHFVLRLIVVSVIPHLWNGGTGTFDGNANTVLNVDYVHLVFLTSLSLLQKKKKAAVLDAEGKETFCLNKKKKLRLIVLNNVFGKKTLNKRDFSHKIVYNVFIFLTVPHLLSLL